MKALKSYYLDDWPLLPVIFQFFQLFSKTSVLLLKSVVFTET